MVLIHQKIPIMLLWAVIHSPKNNYSYLKAFLTPALPSMIDQGQQKQFNVVFWVSWWVKENGLRQLGSARHISVTLPQPE